MNKMIKSQGKGIMLNGGLVGWVEKVGPREWRGYSRISDIEYRAKTKKETMQGYVKAFLDA
jgi:hypothetical protein